MRRYVYGLLSLGSLCILLSAAGAQRPFTGQPPEREGAPPPPPRIPCSRRSIRTTTAFFPPRKFSRQRSLKKLDRNGDGKLRKTSSARRAARTTAGRGPGDAGRASGVAVVRMHGSAARRPGP